GRVLLRAPPSHRLYKSRPSFPRPSRVARCPLAHLRGVAGGRPSRCRHRHGHVVGLDAGDHRRVCGCGRRRHRDATDRGLQRSARYAALHLTHGGRQARTAMTRLLATADDRLPLPRVDGRIIDAIHQSGLVGRGGAAFPTAVKWRAVAERSGGNAVVVVNGAEGEPRSQKDRLLMTTRPHLILDGAFIAVRVLRARRVVLYIGERHEAAQQAMLRALSERHEPERKTVAFAAAPARYVAGAEQAAIHFVNEGIATPTNTPPYPFERGVDGAPTLVQNVETLARVALLARGTP